MKIIKGLYCIAIVMVTISLPIFGGEQLSQKAKDMRLEDAIRERRSSEVKQWLEAGADIEARGSLNTTPLMLAIFKSSLSIVELLLQRGAKVDAVNSLGETPLFLAVKTNDPALVELLLRYDAMVGDSSKLIKEANERGNAKIIWMLRKEVHRESSKPNEQLFSAIRRGKSHVVENLLKKKLVKIEAIDTNGDTPLLAAIAMNNPVIVKLLLDNGAKTENIGEKIVVLRMGQEATQVGDTPLVRAVKDRGIDYEIVRLLIFAKANKEAIDSEGLTPWEILVRRDFKTKKDIDLMSLIGGNKKFATWQVEQGTRLPRDLSGIVYEYAQ